MLEATGMLLTEHGLHPETQSVQRGLEEEVIAKTESRSSPFTVEKPAAIQLFHFYREERTDCLTSKDIQMFCCVQ